MNAAFDSLKTTWAAMEPRRRIAFAASLVVAAVFLFLMARIVTTPNMALLYSGLDSTAASGVVEALDRQGVRHEVRGDAIYVPSDQRDRVRITLAGEGLPTAGAAGYELLDGLSGFGTTAEMFDAAYLRAKEGELARTILAFSRVVRARVHIANARRRPFEKRAEPTASVTVSTTGGPLARDQAEAIRFLVASAVGGLTLTNVAVIDQEHGVVLRSGDDGAKTAADDAAGKSEALRRSVTRLLEARVGPGAAVVEVAVETTADSETVSERLIDPQSRVIIHKDTEESTDAAEGESAAVTVASNLADGDVGGADQSSREAERTRERVNYEVSETRRERVRPAGEVRRLTVAVMVDGVRGVDADGQPLWSPRPEEELAALKALVQSAVGFDEARGDVVTIESLEFSEIGQAGAVAESGLTQSLAANAASIIQLLVLGAVALALGLFVIRPILSGGRAAATGPAALPPTDEIAQIDMARNAEDAARGAPARLTDEAAVDAPDSLTRVDKRELLESAVAENADKAARLIGAWLDGVEREVVR